VVSPELITRAAELIRNGGLVAFPTETVYGLGANSLNPDAVRRIFRAKQRPLTSPLIVHVNSVEMARSLSRHWPHEADLLAARFWPGPLTLIVPKAPAVPDIVTAGLDTVGLRMPAHEIALALIAAAGVGIAAPFIASWFPSARALAAGAPVEYDVSKIEPGQQITIEWRGKPVWILHRTKEMLDRLPGNAPLLVDPDSKEEQQPKYIKGVDRSVKPEYLVAVGVCTHLGCSPTLKKEIGAASDMGADWPGGYYCPCHNSRFDLSARVFKGSPAPKNLVIPPYHYPNDKVVVVGEDPKGA
jgi:ubiquinol-cytochrome c reductase iron-sulfur subunit